MPQDSHALHQCITLLPDHVLSFTGGRRQFHVLFFGNEKERGWINETSVIPYEGKAAFDKFCIEMVTVHKKERRLYEVSPFRFNAWNIAIAAAEATYPLIREDRIQKLVTFQNTPAIDVNCVTTLALVPTVPKRKRRRVSKYGDELSGEDLEPPKKRAKKSLAVVENPEKSGANAPIEDSQSVDKIVTTDLLPSPAKRKNGELMDKGETTSSHEKTG